MSANSRQRTANWRRLEICCESPSGAAVPAARRRADHSSASLSNPAAQREQVPGQISAVHRRHVVRPQRLQRVRVVPVVKMPAETHELVHRFDRARGPLYQDFDGNILEIVSRQIGQKRQADVSRRSSTGDSPGRIFLKIVGRQIVIVRASKLLEELPSSAGNHVQENIIVFSKSRRLPADRRAQPGRNRRRRKPKSDD